MKLSTNAHLLALASTLSACSAASDGSGQPTAQQSAELAADKPGTFVTFDVPGSVCEPSFPRRTTPTAINPAGAVTGFYADQNGALHGFVRAADGRFTLFDGPNAVCPSELTVCTQPSGITPEGQIAGTYCDAVTCHGFLRATDGTITTIDPSGSIFTQISGVSVAGVVTGSFADASFVFHGFVQARDGKMATFDAPGEVNGTFPSAINPSEVIAGVFNDVNFTPHGFVRDHKGSIEAFDPTGSLFTQVNTVNSEGTVAGAFDDALGGHGFLRARDGAITTFDVPGETNTAIVSLADSGSFAGDFEAGTFDDGAPSFHGFVQSGSGRLTTFDPPGSVDTIVAGLNPRGVVTGWFVDSANLIHGYLRIP